MASWFASSNFPVNQLCRATVMAYYQFTIPIISNMFLFRLTKLREHYPWHAPFPVSSSPSSIRRHIANVLVIPSDDDDAVFHVNSCVVLMRPRHGSRTIGTRQTAHGNCCCTPELWVITRLDGRNEIVTECVFMIRFFLYREHALSWKLQNC